MPYAYTGQKGRDFIVKIGSSVLECTQKSLNRSRRAVDITTDYYLQQTGTFEEELLDEDIELTLSCPVPDYGQTSTAYDAVETAYLNNSQLTNTTAVTITWDANDSGTAYNGRVKSFNIPGAPAEYSIAEISIRLTKVAGS
jgi:hypothetical protein